VYVFRKGYIATLEQAGQKRKIKDSDKPYGYTPVM